MKPLTINDIEIVEEKIAKVRKTFKRPMVVPYTMLQDWYGPPCNNEV